MKKATLLLLCLLYLALLLLSIRYQPLRMATGNIQQPRIQNR